MKNFLSFANGQKVVFQDKHNVIVGANDSGKTNLFRALTFVSSIVERRWKSDTWSFLKSYFNNANYDEPVEVEVEVIFSEEEIELLTTFFLLASLVAASRDGDKPQKEDKKELLLKHGRRLFTELLGDVSIIVRLENRHDYPISFIVSLKEDNKILYIHSYGRITDKPVDISRSATVLNFPKILHEEFVNSALTIEGYKPPSIFELSLSALKKIQAAEIDVSGFNFSNDISTIQNWLPKELVTHYQRLRSTLTKSGFKHDAINLIELLNMIYSGSLVRISNIRSLPEDLILTEDTLTHPADSYYHELSGKELPAILFRLKNSFDPQDAIALKEIREQFRKIMDADFDVILRPKKVTSTVNELDLTYFPTAFSEISHSDAGRPLVIRSREIERTEYELVISFTKNNLIIPVELAAAGMFETLYLLTVIIYHHRKVLLLDEPAANLHPDMQRRILDLIKNYTIKKNQNQVIMTTHSPYMVEANVGENTWRFFSTDKGTNSLRVIEGLADLNQKDREQILRNLKDADIRSILFSRGVVLVEGASDRFVVQEVDRYLSKKGKGADLENNEWNVIEIDGKKNLKYYVELTRRLRVPSVAIMDHDALMKHEGTVEYDAKKINTSSAFIGLSQILSSKEKDVLKQVERSVIVQKNSKGKDETWYENNQLTKLSKISLKHGIFTLSKDLEGVLQEPATKKESKPLKVLDWLSKITSEKDIPEELKAMDRYLRSRVKAARNYHST